MKEKVEQRKNSSETSSQKGFFEEQAIHKWEFVILLGLIMGLNALCVDSLLPALSPMKKALEVSGENKMQLVFSFLFFGLALGQLFYGTLSDSFGRKMPMYAGFVVLIIGTVLSIFAQSLGFLLFARFLQGFGLASPKTLSLAIVRDQFEGEKMARILSFVRAVFVLIPTVAPALGLLIITLASWQTIFVVMAVFSGVLLIWFYVRMPETLEEEDRLDLSYEQVKKSIQTIAEHKAALAYTLLAGLCTGAFIGFLNCAQPLLQEHYQLKQQFVFYMGGISLCSGIASLGNSWLVQKYSMLPLMIGSLVVLSALSAVVGGGILIGGWELSLGWALAYLCIALFFTGILFGNMNSLAMKPLGDVAGMASTMVGAAATLIGTGIGTLVGALYQDGILAVVVGYFSCCVLGLVLVFLAKNYEQKEAEG